MYVKFCMMKQGEHFLRPILSAAKALQNGDSGRQITRIALHAVMLAPEVLEPVKQASQTGFVEFRYFAVINEVNQLTKNVFRVGVCAIGAWCHTDSIEV